MINLLKKPIIKNILYILAVAFFGFILLNLTFLFDALYQGLLGRLFGLFMNKDLGVESSWFPLSMHLSFALLICLLSFFIFKTHLGTLYKAIFLTVPTAVILATIGIYLSNWPMILYPIGYILCIGVLYYFYRTKKHWLYNYSVLLVALTMAIFTLIGGDI